MAPPDVKLLPISEFRANGYLHEVNRLVLHPLGLALEARRASVEAGRVVSFREADVPEILAELDRTVELLNEGTAVPGVDSGVIAKLAGSIRNGQVIERGEEMLGGVWDCREYPEGMEFDDDLLSPEKAKAVLGELMLRRAERIRQLGWVIQPIPGEKVLTTNYTDPDPPVQQYVEGVGEVEFE